MKSLPLFRTRAVATEFARGGGRYEAGLLAKGLRTFKRTAISALLLTLGFTSVSYAGQKLTEANLKSASGIVTDAFTFNASDYSVVNYTGNIFVIGSGSLQDATSSVQPYNGYRVSDNLSVKNGNQLNITGSLTLSPSSGGEAILFDQYGLLTLTGDYTQNNNAIISALNARIVVGGTANVGSGTLQLGGTRQYSTDQYGQGYGHMIVRGDGGLILGSVSSTASPSVQVYLGSTIHTTSLTMYRGSISVSGSSSKVRVGDSYNGSTNSWIFTDASKKDFNLQGGSVTISGSGASFEVNGKTEMSAGTSIFVNQGSFVTEEFSASAPTGSVSKATIKHTSNSTASFWVKNDESTPLDLSNTAFYTPYANLSVLTGEGNTGSKASATLNNTDFYGSSYVTLKEASIEGITNVGVTSGSTTTAGKLVVTGDLTLKENGELALNGASTVQAGSFDAQSGKISSSKGSGTVEVSTTEATLDLSNAAVNVDGTGTLTFKYKKGGSTLTTSNLNLGVASVAGTLNAGDATLNGVTTIGDGTTYGGKLSGTGTVTLAEGATLSLKGTSSKTATLQAQTFVANGGTIKATSGKAVIQVTTDPSNTPFDLTKSVVEVGSGATLTLGYLKSTLNTRSVTLKDATVAGTFNMANGTLTAGGTLTLKNQETKDAKNIAASGTFTAEGTSENRAKIAFEGEGSAYISVTGQTTLTSTDIDAGSGTINLSTILANDVSVKGSVIAESVTQQRGNTLLLRDGASLNAIDGFNLSDGTEKAIIKVGNDSETTAKAYLGSLLSVALEGHKIEAQGGALVLGSSDLMLSDATLGEVELASGTLTAGSTTLNAGANFVLGENAKLQVDSLTSNGTSSNKASITASKAGSIVLTESSTTALLNDTNLISSSSEALSITNSDNTVSQVKLNDSTVKGNVQLGTAFVDSGKVLTVSKNDSGVSSLETKNYSVSGSLTIEEGASASSTDTGATSTIGTLTNSGAFSIAHKTTVTSYVGNKNSTLDGEADFIVSTSFKNEGKVGKTTALKSFTATKTASNAGSFNTEALEGAGTFTNTGTLSAGTLSNFTGTLSNSGTLEATFAGSGKVTNTGAATAASLTGFTGTYTQTSSTATLTSTDKSQFNSAKIEVSNGAYVADALIGSDNTITVGSGSAAHTAGRLGTGENQNQFTDSGTTVTAMTYLTGNNYVLNGGTLYTSFNDFFEDYVSGTVTVTEVNDNGTLGEEKVLKSRTEAEIGSVKKAYKDTFSFTAGTIDLDGTYTATLVTKVLNQIKSDFSLSSLSQYTSGEKTATNRYVYFSGDLNTSSGGSFFNVSFVNDLTGDETATNVVFKKATLANTKTSGSSEVKTNTTLIVAGSDATETSGSNTLKGTGIIGFEALSNTNSLTIKDNRTLILTGFDSTATDQRLIQATSSATNGSATIEAGSTLTLGLDDGSMTQGEVGAVTVKGDTASETFGTLKVQGGDQFTAGSVTLEDNAKLTLSGSSNASTTDTTKLTLAKLTDNTNSSITVGTGSELVIDSLNGNKIEGSVENNGTLSLAGNTADVTFSKAYSNEGTTALNGSKTTTFAAGLTNGSAEATNAQITGDGAKVSVTGSVTNYGTIGKVTSEGETTTNEGLSSLTSTASLDNEGTIHLKTGTLSAATVSNAGTTDGIKTLSATGSAATDANSNSGTLTFTGSDSTLTVATSLTNTGTIENLGSASVTGTLTNKKATGEGSEAATIGFTGDESKLTVTGKVDNQTGSSITGLHTLEQKGTGDTSGVANAGTLSFNGAGSSMTLEGNLNNQSTGVIENLASISQTGVTSKITNSGSLGDATTGEKTSTLTSIETQGTLENTGSVYLKDGTIKATTLTNAKEGETGGAIVGIKTLEATTVTNTAGSLTFNGSSDAKLTATNSLTNTGSITGLKEISQTATSGENPGITNSGTLGEETQSKLTTISTAATLENTGSIYMTDGSVTAKTLKNDSASATVASIKSLKTTGTEVSTNAGTLTFTESESSLVTAGSFTNTGAVENLTTASVTGTLTNKKATGEGSEAATIGFTGDESKLTVTGKVDNQTGSSITGLHTLEQKGTGDTSGVANAGTLSFNGAGSSMTLEGNLNNQSTGVIENLASISQTGVTSKITNSGSLGDATAGEKTSTLTSIDTKGTLENTGSVYLKDGTIKAATLDNTKSGETGGAITGIKTLEATTVTNTAGSLTFNGSSDAKLTVANSLANTGSITGLKEISQTATSGENLGITNSGTLGEETQSKLTTISTAATLTNTGSIYLSEGSVTASTFTNTKAEGASTAGSIAGVKSLTVTGATTSTNAGTVTFTGSDSTLTSTGTGVFTNTGKLENLGSVSVKGNLTGGDGSTETQIALADGSKGSVTVEGKLENKTNSKITGIKTLVTGTKDATEASVNAGELDFTGNSASLTANSGFTNSGTIKGLTTATVTGTFTNSGSVGEAPNATLTSLNATSVENTGSVYFKDGELETGAISNTAGGTITGLNTGTVTGSFVNGEDSPATTTSTVDFSGSATEKKLSITDSGSLTNKATGSITNLTDLVIAGSNASSNAGTIGSETKAVTNVTIGTKGADTGAVTATSTLKNTGNLYAENLTVTKGSSLTGDGDTYGAVNVTKVLTNDGTFDAESIGTSVEKITNTGAFKLTGTGIATLSVATLTNTKEAGSSDASGSMDFGSGASLAVTTLTNNTGASISAKSITVGGESTNAGKITTTGDLKATGTSFNSTGEITTGGSFVVGAASLAEGVTTNTAATITGTLKGTGTASSIELKRKATLTFNSVDSANPTTVSGFSNLAFSEGSTLNVGKDVTVSGIGFTFANDSTLTNAGTITLDSSKLVNGTLSLSGVTGFTYDGSQGALQYTDNGETKNVKLSGATILISTDGLKTDANQLVNAGTSTTFKVVKGGTLVFADDISVSEKLKDAKSYVESSQMTSGGEYAQSTVVIEGGTLKTDLSTFFSSVTESKPAVTDFSGEAIEGSVFTGDASVVERTVGVVKESVKAIVTTFNSGAIAFAENYTTGLVNSVVEQINSAYKNGGDAIVEGSLPAEGTTTARYVTFDGENTGSTDGNLTIADANQIKSELTGVAFSSTSLKGDGTSSTLEFKNAATVGETASNVVTTQKLGVQTVKGNSTTEGGDAVVVDKVVIADNHTLLLAGTTKEESDTSYGQLLEGAASGGEIDATNGHLILGDFSTEKTTGGTVGTVSVKTDADATAGASLTAQGGDQFTITTLKVAGTSASEDKGTAALTLKGSGTNLTALSYEDNAYVTGIVGVGATLTLKEVASLSGSYTTETGGTLNVQSVKTDVGETENALEVAKTFTNKGNFVGGTSDGTQKTKIDVTFESGFTNGDSKSQDASGSITGVNTLTSLGGSTNYGAIGSKTGSTTDAISELIVGNSEASTDKLTNETQGKIYANKVTVNNSDILENKGTIETTTVAGSGKLTNEGTLAIGTGSEVDSSTITIGCLENTKAEGSDTAGTISGVKTLKTTSTSDSSSNAGTITFTESGSSLEASSSFTNTGSIENLTTGTIAGAFTNGDSDTETTSSLAFVGTDSKLDVTGIVTNEVGSSITGLKTLSQGSESTAGSSLGITNKGTLGESGEGKTSLLTSVTTKGKLDNTGSINLAAGSAVSSVDFSNTGDGNTSGVIAGVTTLTTTGSNATNGGSISFQNNGETKSSLTAKQGFTNTGSITNLVTGTVTGDLTNGAQNETGAEIDFDGASQLTVTGKLDNKTGATINDLVTLETGSVGATSAEASQNAGSLNFTGETASLTAHNGFTNDGSMTGLTKATVTGTFTNTGSIDKAAGEGAAVTLKEITVSEKLENTGIIALNEGTIDAKDFANKKKTGSESTSGEISGVASLKTTGTATNEGKVTFTSTDSSTDPSLDVSSGTFTNTKGGELTGLGFVKVTGALVNGEDGGQTTSKIDFTGTGTKKLEVSGEGSFVNKATGSVTNLSDLTISGTGASSNAGTIGSDGSSGSTGGRVTKVSIGLVGESGSSGTVGTFTNTGTIYADEVVVTKGSSLTGGVAGSVTGVVDTESLTNDGTFTAKSMGETTDSITNTGSFILTDDADKAMTVTSLTNTKVAGSDDGTGSMDFGAGTALTVGTLTNGANASIRAKSITIEGVSSNSGSITATGGDVKATGTSFESTGEIATAGTFTVGADSVKKDGSNTVATISGSLKGTATSPAISAIKLNEKATLSLTKEEGQTADTTVTGFSELNLGKDSKLSVGEGVSVGEIGNFKFGSGSTLENKGTITVTTDEIDLTQGDVDFTYSGSSGKLQYIDGEGNAQDVKLSGVTLLITTDGLNTDANQFANAGKKVTFKIEESGTIVLADDLSSNTILKDAKSHLTTESIISGDYANSTIVINGGTLKTDTKTFFGGVNENVDVSVTDMTGKAITDVFEEGASVGGSYSVGPVVESLKDRITFTSGAISFADDFTTDLVNSVLGKLNTTYGADASNSIKYKSGDSATGTTRWAAFEGTSKFDNTLSITNANKIKDGETGAVFSTTSLEGEGKGTVTFGDSVTDETESSLVTTKNLGVQTIVASTDTSSTPVNKVIVKDEHTLLLTGNTEDQTSESYGELLEGATDGGEIDVEDGNLILGDFDKNTDRSGSVGKVTVTEGGSLTAQGGDDFTVKDLAITGSTDAQGNTQTSKLIVKDESKLTADKYIDNALIEGTIGTGSTFTIKETAKLDGSYTVDTGSTFKVESVPETGEGGSQPLVVGGNFKNNGSFVGGTEASGEGSTETTIDVTFKKGFTNGDKDAGAAGSITGVGTLTTLGSSTNAGSIGTGDKALTAIVIGDGTETGKGTLSNTGDGAIYAEKVTVKESSTLTNGEDASITASTLTGADKSLIDNDGNIKGLNTVDTTGTIKNVGTIDFSTEVGTSATLKAAVLENDEGKIYNVKSIETTGDTENNGTITFTGSDGDSFTSGGNFTALSGSELTGLDNLTIKGEGLSSNEGTIGTSEDKLKTIVIGENENSTSAFTNKEGGSISTVSLEIKGTGKLTNETGGSIDAEKLITGTGGLTNEGRITGLTDAQIGGDFSGGKDSSTDFSGTDGKLAVSGSLTNAGSIGKDSGSHPRTIEVGTEGSDTGLTNEGEIYASTIDVKGDSGLANEGKIDGLDTLKTAGDFKNTGLGSSTTFIDGGAGKLDVGGELTNESTISGLKDASTKTGTNSGVMEFSASDESGTGTESKLTVKEGGDFTNDETGTITGLNDLVIGTSSGEAATFTNNGTLTGSGDTTTSKGVSVTINKGATSSGGEASTTGFINVGDATLGALTGDGSFTVKDGSLAFGDNGDARAFTGDFTQTGGSSTFTKETGFVSGDVEIEGGILTTETLKGRDDATDNTITLTGGTLKVTGEGSKVDHKITVTGGTLEADDFVAGSEGNETVTITGEGKLVTKLDNLVTIDGSGNVTSTNKVKFGDESSSSEKNKGTAQLTDESVSLNKIVALASTLSSSTSENAIYHTGDDSSTKASTTITVTGDVTDNTGTKLTELSLIDTARDKGTTASGEDKVIFLSVNYENQKGVLPTRSQVAEKGNVVIDPRDPVGNTLVLATYKITEDNALTDDNSGTDENVKVDSLFQHLGNLGYATFDLRKESNKIFVTGDRKLTLFGAGSSSELLENTENGAESVIYVGNTEDVDGNNKAGSLQLGSETSTKGGKLNGTIRVRADSTVDVLGEGTFDIKKITIADNGKVNVGNRLSSGSLVVNTMEVNGGSLYLDPAFGSNLKATEVAIETLTVSGDSSNSGRVVVGENSKLSVGTTDTTALNSALSAVENATGKVFSASGIRAAAYIANDVTIGENGGLVVDGNATGTTGYGNGVTVKDQSVLILKTGSKISTNATGMNFSAEPGSVIALDGASANSVVTIASGFEYDSNVASANYLGVNGLLSVEFASATDNGNLTLNVKGTPIETLNATTVASALTDAFQNNRLDSSSLAYQRLQSIFDATKSGYSLKTAGAALNKIAFMNAAGAATNTILTSAFTATDSVEGHLGSLEAGKIDSESHLWAHAEAESTRVTSYDVGNFNYGFKSNIAGLTVGCDASQKYGTLGVAFTAGRGTVKGLDVSSGTKNTVKFWGVSVYGKTLTPYGDLMGSLSYLQSSNKTSLEGYSAKPKAKAFTAAARFEKAIPASNRISFVPHAGVRFSSVASDNFDAGGFAYDSDRANVVTVPFGVALKGEIPTKSGALLKPLFDLTVVPAFGDTKSKQSFKAIGSSVEDNFNARVMSSMSWGATLGVKIEKSAHALDFGYAVKFGTDGRVDQNLRAKYTYRF